MFANHLPSHHRVGLCWQTCHCQSPTQHEARSVSTPNPLPLDYNSQLHSHTDEWKGRELQTKYNVRLRDVALKPSRSLKILPETVSPTSTWLCATFVEHPHFILGFLMTIMVVISTEPRLKRKDPTDAFRCDCDSKEKRIKHTIPDGGNVAAREELVTTQPDTRFIKTVEELVTWMHDNVNWNDFFGSLKNLGPSLNTNGFRFLKSVVCDKGICDAVIPPKTFTYVDEPGCDIHTTLRHPNGGTWRIESKGLDTMWDLPNVEKTNSIILSNNRNESSTLTREQTFDALLLVKTSEPFMVGLVDWNDLNRIRGDEIESRDGKAGITKQRPIIKEGTAENTAVIPTRWNRKNIVHFVTGVTSDIPLQAIDMELPLYANGTHGPGEERVGFIKIHRPI